jgi:hypothetical protein
MDLVGNVRRRVLLGAAIDYRTGKRRGEVENLVVNHNSGSPESVTSRDRRCQRPCVKANNGMAVFGTSPSSAERRELGHKAEGWRRAQSLVIAWLGWDRELPMMRLSRTRTVAIAVALFIAGIAIGFLIPRPVQIAPVRSAGHDRLGNATSQPIGRNVYSPDIRHDEYVLQDQRKVVEMLEQQCRATRKDCALAGAARQALTRNLR